MTARITPEKIMQTAFGFWPAKTLLSAVEMELFTELAKHMGIPPMKSSAKAARASSTKPRTPGSNALWR